MDALLFWKDSDRQYCGELTDNELLAFQANIESEVFFSLVNIKTNFFYVLFTFLY